MTDENIKPKDNLTNSMFYIVVLILVSIIVAYFYSSYSTDSDITIIYKSDVYQDFSKKYPSVVCERMSNLHSEISAFECIRPNTFVTENNYKLMIYIKNNTVIDSLIVKEEECLKVKSSE